ncbi:MAG: septal ring lytic transglycosylase RlpA family protein [Spirochaetota bacterium]|nr:septal ring lytic transglycosylase RlpA family protein [Spirochaetota bacterium]
MLNVVKKATKVVPVLLVVLIISSISPVFTQQAARITKDNATKYLYGITSWYGNDFNDQTTASGAKYAPDTLTGAHRSLPFGTRIEVENLSNGKKVEVIINDRGPFEQNRVLNLSKQAATILEFIAEGTTFVKITILELGTSLPSPIGLPTPPIGKDIPYNLANTPTNNVTPEKEEDTFPVDTEEEYTEAEDYEELASDDLFNSNDELFANIDDELDFMDDDFQSELVNKDSELKAQVISNSPSSFANNNPAVEATGFISDTNDILIDDPLSNITIGPDDEYVAVSHATPEALNSIPNKITSSEKQLLEDNIDDDPFSDLFNESSDPYSFQDEIANSLVSPTAPTNAQDTAYNLDASPTNDRRDTLLPLSEEDDYGYDISEYPQSEPPVSPPTPKEKVPEPPVSPLTSEEKVPEPPVSPLTSEEKNTEPFTPQKIGNHYIIQLGAFSKQKNALELYNSLREAGFNAYITDIKIKNKNLMRVRVGYFTNIDEALKSSQELEKIHQIENRIIKVDYEKENNI